MWIFWCSQHNTSKMCHRDQTSHYTSWSTLQWTRIKNDCFDKQSKKPGVHSFELSDHAPPLPIFFLKWINWQNKHVDLYSILCRCSKDWITSTIYALHLRPTKINHYCFSTIYQINQSIDNVYAIEHSVSMTAENAIAQISFYSLTNK